MWPAMDLRRPLVRPILVNPSNRRRLCLWLVTALGEITVLAVVLLAGPASLWAAPTAPGSATSGYRPPLPPRPLVITGFSVGEHRWSPGHRGVDLAATVGTTVYSAGAGRVHFVGSVAGRPVISVRHPDGILTTYEPVSGPLRRGDRVAAGTPLGTVVAGHASCPGRTCVHWGARRGSGTAAVYINPLALLGAVTVRLKPIADRN